MTGDPLSAADFARIALLHRDTLHDSPLGRLGIPLLSRYYQFVAASREEQLVTARTGPAVQGAAVVSFGADTVLRRFVRRAPVAFASAVAIRFAVDGALRREVMAYAREAVGGGDTAIPVAELLQIFVAADQQGRSIGRRLIDDVEGELKRRGVGAYDTRTILDDNERTLAFYRGLGFERIGERVFCGRRYAQLRKTLSAPTR